MDNVYDSDLLLRGFNELIKIIFLSTYVINV